jgi:hypothetical protein
LADEKRCEGDVDDDSFVNGFSDHFSDELEQVKMVVRQVG